ncbi:hypothetical protein [Roseburia sp. 1XD42-69]|uniref:hypothetical protein n=1 Tax=Roseburia sp. 1XD42-69 TaxID=2320088 RepID=UPI002FE5BB84
MADFARVGRIHTEPWRGVQYLALQRLTRHRLHITECISREKTYMLNNIFLKFSEFAMLNKDEHPFSDKYGATAEAVLTDYLSTEDIVDASVEDLVAFISSKSLAELLNAVCWCLGLQGSGRHIKALSLKSSKLVVNSA